MRALLVAAVAALALFPNVGHVQNQADFIAATYDLDTLRVLHGVIDKIEFDASPRPLIWVKATGTSVFGQTAITPNAQYWRVEGGSLMQLAETRTLITPRAEVSIVGRFGRDTRCQPACLMSATHLTLKNGCRLRIATGSQPAGSSQDGSPCLPPWKEGEG